MLLHVPRAAFAVLCACASSAQVCHHDTAKPCSSVVLATLLTMRRCCVADMDRVLLKMWDIHCAGEGPRTFEV